MKEAKAGRIYLSNNNDNNVEVEKYFGIRSSAVSEAVSDEDKDRSKWKVTEGDRNLKEINKWKMKVWPFLFSFFELFIDEGSSAGIK